MMKLQKWLVTVKLGLAIEHRIKSRLTLSLSLERHLALTAFLQAYNLAAFST